MDQIQLQLGYRWTSLQGPSQDSVDDGAKSDDSVRIAHTILGLGETAYSGCF